MSRKPKANLRRPGRKKVSEEAAAALEKRLDERSTAPAGVAETRTTVSSQSREPVDVQSREIVEERSVDRQLRRGRARGKGTMDEPYVRATDGVAKRSTTVFMPVELHKRLKRYCAIEEQKMSAVVSEAIERYLDQQ